jgi:hypothetical protein
MIENDSTCSSGNIEFNTNQVIRYPIGAVLDEILQSRNLGSMLEAIDSVCAPVDTQSTDS